MSEPIYELGNYGSIGRVQTEVVENVWHCDHCDATITVTSNPVITHACPDGHIPNRFRAERGVSDDDFEKYRQEIIRSLEVNGGASRVLQGARRLVGRLGR